MGSAITATALLVAIVGWGGTHASTSAAAVARDGPGCSATVSKRFVLSLLDAINDGDIGAMDRLVAKGEAFKWYSVGTERVGDEAQNRSTLTTYIESRFAMGETLRLMRFRFTGLSEGGKYAHFTLVMLRSARDFPEARVLGKGAVDCSAEAPQLAVWSLGPPASPDPLRPATGYRDFCDGMSPRQQRRVCGNGRVSLAFWRPLKLPTIAADEPCPVAHLHNVSGVRGYGPGPVYPTHIIPWVETFPPPENSVAWGTGWSADKTPLIWKKRFRSSFLIRGGRIDGEGELGFSGPAGRRPFAAMQFAAGRAGLEVSGLRGWPIIVWMTTPGCYAFQIDGKTFSRVVVFRVTVG